MEKCGRSSQTCWQRGGQSSSSSAHATGSHTAIMAKVSVTSLFAAGIDCSLTIEQLPHLQLWHKFLSWAQCFSKTWVRSSVSQLLMYRLVSKLRPLGSLDKCVIYSTFRFFSVEMFEVYFGTWLVVNAFFPLLYRFEILCFNQHARVYLDRSMAGMHLCPADVMNFARKTSAIS